MIQELHYLGNSCQKSIINKDVETKERLQIQSPANLSRFIVLASVTS